MLSGKGNSSECFICKGYSVCGGEYRVHRGREEIGGVYLPAQLERPLQLWM